MRIEVAIIGGGRAAWCFASVLMAAEDLSVRVGARSHPEPFRTLGVPLVSIGEAVGGATTHLLLAVPDDAIEQVWSELSATVGSSVVPFHASGALSSELFGGRDGFSLHPLAALPAPGERVDLSGTLFAWEGSRETIAAASRIVEAFGGKFNEISTAEKIRYHAAAVFGSNYVAALLEVAARLMRESGVENPQESIASLARSAVESWLQGNRTGPVVRGDVEIVRQHLDKLEEADRELYIHLATRLVEMVEAGETNSDGLGHIKALLDRYHRS